MIIICLIIIIIIAFTQLSQPGPRKNSNSNG